MTIENASIPGVVNESQTSEINSQTAQEYISTQLQLEADAKEALPYQFDSCTRPLGPLRQSLFSCLTCNPPSESDATEYTPAGVCYSCSISCHGEHTLVELFAKRDFECDCGTTRVPKDTPCTLRSNPEIGLKGGVSGNKPRAENKYNQNFAGHFCACGDVYDPTQEKGTMFQCLGLGTAENDGCGEDWWHPECLMGMIRQKHKSNGDLSEPVGTGGEKAPSHNANDGITTNPQQNGDLEEAPLPLGFPDEDDFDHLICYKCIEKEPWLKRYAGTPGFLPAVLANGDQHHPAATQSKTDLAGDSLNDINQQPTTGAKRKVEDAEELEADTDNVKRVRVDDDPTNVIGDTADSIASATKHESLPTAPNGLVSLFLKEDFRDHFCKCVECFPKLKPYPQLLDEEESYEPPLSESDPGEANGTGSVGSRSLLDRGEAALSTMDRMRAIEGVMAYNHLKDKVKAFLQPFAESGQTVGAEDVKAYFAKLRGDEDDQRAAAASADKHGDNDNDGDGRRAQGGY